MLRKTRSLQQAPTDAQGGRMKSQVNAGIQCVNDSTRQNMLAALSPLVLICRPSKSPDTENRRVG